MRIRMRCAAERIESSDLGRVAISALIVVALVAMLTANLPESVLKRRLSSVADPVIRGSGLVQVWGVFAPDPRRQSLDIEAQIRFADGTSSTWRDPTGSPLLGDYWLVRWRKLIEWGVADQYRDILWRPLATWIARQAATGARRPVQVVLIRRWRDLNPPGKTPSRSPWHQAVYFSLDVTADVLATGGRA